MSYDVEALRAREFPWTQLGGQIFLDNAKTGALPARTVKTLEQWADLRAEPHRLTTYQDLEVFRKTRELIAKLIGAKVGEIACMPNTSYGINVASLGLPLKAGDVVLTYEGEYPADVYPWMSLARKGVKLELIPKRDGLQDEARLLEELKRPEVKRRDNELGVVLHGLSCGSRDDRARMSRARHLFRGRRDSGRGRGDARRVEAARRRARMRRAEVAARSMGLRLRVRARGAARASSSRLSLAGWR